MGLEEKLQQAAGSLGQILPDLSDEQLGLLAGNGINSADAFEGVEAQDLVGFGFSEEDATRILAKVSEYLQTQ